VGLGCGGDGDCASGACDSSSHLCVADACTDGHLDGAESDTDCGGGTCPACEAGLGCTVDSDCTTGACDSASHLCVADGCADHHQDGVETAIDCGGACPGCGVGEVCASDSDCASAACDTETHLCVADACADHHLDGDETAPDCGGGTCPLCAPGKACAIDTDCASAACDSETHVCVTSTCLDHHLDGAESDLDCGGGCAACELGGHCGSDADCTTSACDFSSSICVALQCADGHRDGSESDVDCGGTCAPCAVGNACGSGDDCASGMCTGFVCTPPACSDGVRDGRETDQDCGGLCPACALDLACAVPADCASTDCVAGVCTVSFLDSDASWVWAVSPPSDWKDLGFDDSSWQPAVPSVPYGSAPWVTASMGLPATVPASWIWSVDWRPTNEAPIGEVDFRRVFVANKASYTLYADADNYFSVYLDGVQVLNPGPNHAWLTAEHVTLNTTVGQPHVLAVVGVNTGGPAGVLIDLR
jgi:hypothetical protein